jgi:hypothetical protein
MAHAEIRSTISRIGLIFEDYLTLGMKKFPYLKTGPFGNPIFLPGPGDKLTQRFRRIFVPSSNFSEAKKIAKMLQDIFSHI